MEQSDPPEPANREVDLAPLGFKSATSRDRKLARSVYSGPILSELRSAIISRRLPTATRLVEERLATEFGVSRGPIRSALLALEAEGLVSSLRTGGMVVAGFGLADLSSLFRARLLLESSAVEWGVDSGADATPVTAALARFEAHQGESPASLVAVDILFHRSIVEFGQSRFLLQAWNSLAPVLEAAIAAGNDAIDGEAAHTKTGENSRSQLLFEAHVPLAEAIARGDKADAISLLDQQFKRAEIKVRHYYATQALDGSPDEAKAEA